MVITLSLPRLPQCIWSKHYKRYFSLTADKELKAHGVDLEKDGEKGFFLTEEKASELVQVIDDMYKYIPPGSFLRDRISLIYMILFPPKLER